jgi:hypothetical protein
MIRFKSLALMSLAGLLTLSACKKEETPVTPPSNEPAAGAMSASIDGNSWKSDIASGTIQNGYINITGKNNAGETITLTLNGTTKATYTLNNGTMHVGVYQKTNGSLGYTTNASGTTGGTVTVTEIDEANKTISGTFSFSAEEPSSGNKVSVTAGKFNKVKYTTSSGTTNNTLSAKVDGNAWTGSSVFAVLNSGKIAVTGTSGSSSMGIYMPEGVTPGTYSLSMFGSYMAQYNPDQSTFLASDNGTLVVTEHDATARTIKGTFNFNASDFSGSTTATITEGAFSAKY